MNDVAVTEALSPPAAPKSFEQCNPVSRIARTTLHHVSDQGCPSRFLACCKICDHSVTSVREACAMASNEGRARDARNWANDTFSLTPRPHFIYASSNPE
jgi:hypothetical protein